MVSLYMPTLCIIIWLFGRLAIAHQYPRDTASDESTSTIYEIITYYHTGHAPTEKPSTSGPVITSFSSIAGSYIAAYSSTWSQAIIPVTVGTVMFIVNEATNKTTSTTIYHTDFVQNGSTTLLSRTDTNSDGTVTYVATYGLNLSTTITYPTNYLEVAESMTWTAVLPTIISNTTCCFTQDTLSATPKHTPFLRVGPLDTEDPKGWLYSLAGFNSDGGYTQYKPPEVSSLWSGQKLSIEYNGCPYEYCDYFTTAPGAASAVRAQPGGVFATSTTTISIPAEYDLSTAEPLKSTSRTLAPATSAPPLSIPFSTSSPEPTTTATSSGGGENSPPALTLPTSSPTIQSVPSPSDYIPPPGSTSSITTPLLTQGPDTTTENPSLSTPSSTSNPTIPTPNAITPPSSSSTPSTVAGPNIGDIINSMFGGGVSVSSTSSAAGVTAGGNSSSAPPFIQASGGERTGTYRIVSWLLLCDVLVYSVI